jgi:esterase/lipase superfamily enzyme
MTAARVPGGNAPADPARRLLILSGLALAACAPRGAVTLLPEAAGVGAPETLYVASARLPLASGIDDANRMGSGLSFRRVTVSVPPERDPGTVRIAAARPDPARDFVTLDSLPLADGAAFLAAINRAATALPVAAREVTVFVHGFNTTYAEGLYRHAQMRHDFAVPGLSVYFSWPSAARISAYGTDREAVLVARDRLEDLLVLLSRSKARRIVVVGHSMGAFLVMEAMRQLAIRGDARVFARVSTVILIAPDLDIEVFRGQMQALARQDVSVYVFSSSRDRALAVSARLRGQPARLGSMADVSAVADLPVTVIDLSNVATENDALNHFKVATSPAMIALIGGMDRIGPEVFRDSLRSPGLIEASIGLVQEATSVVLVPVAR